MTTEEKVTQVHYCPVCHGKGYTLRETADFIQGEAHNFAINMRFCQCQRGRELELLVETEKGKAYERGQYSVRGDDVQGEGEA